MPTPGMLVRTDEEGMQEPGVRLLVQLHRAALAMLQVFGETRQNDHRGLSAEDDDRLLR